MKLVKNAASAARLITALFYAQAIPPVGLWQVRHSTGIMLCFAA
jgi:hypothetical protein